MGYRELIKKYIRHLELVAGDNFIELPSNEPVLSKRELGELKTLAAEVGRDAYQGHEVDRVGNYNYRLRILMNRYALSADDVAELCGVEATLVRRWRTSPASQRYRSMSESEFTHFERTLTRWLESGAA
ncbi:MAG: hypothetical protein R3E86_17365 [Pseudomonadales bacterium]